MKCKLRLIQPQFMCSGRQPTECTYRGKILKEENGNKLISFKVRGKEIETWYTSDGFLEEELQDIKLITRNLKLETMK